MHVRRALVVVLFCMCSFKIARAQVPSVSTIHVRVRDSAGVAINGAEVALIRGLNDVRGSASTDEHGRATVNVTLPSEAQPADGYGLVVRKIGYQRADEFVKLSRDSVSFDVRLERSIQTMAPVVVSAEEDIKRKAYHIDADQIANSDRPLFDAADILSKLRPDMICGRYCSPLAALAPRTQTGARKCPMLAMQQKAVCPLADMSMPDLETSIWVNGRRIRLMAPDEMATAKQTGMLAGLKPGSMTVLTEIKPEHIAEMTYADEFDNSVGRPGSSEALFIVLKPGVAYEPGAPSYVQTAQI